MIRAKAMLLLRQSLVPSVLVALFLQSGLACSSSDDATPAPSPSPEGGDAAQPGVDFTVFVADPTDPIAWKPLAGASAFIDTASGARIEGTSEADGRVVFKGVSFAEGPASVTAYASGRVIQSITGVTPELLAKAPFLPVKEFPASEKNLTFALPLLKAPSDAVRLSGSILNKLDAANMISLTMSPGRGIFQADSTTYSIDVKKGDPLTAVAMEWNGKIEGQQSYEETKLRFIKLDIPAQNADGNVDLDLATGTALTSTKVTVTLKAPVSDSSIPLPAPGWQIQSATSGFFFFLGSRSKVSLVEGTTYTAEGEFVTSPVASEDILTFAYFPGRAGEFSAFQKSGYPTDGETFEALAYPKAPANAVALGGEVPFDGLSAGVESAGVEVDDNTLNGNNAQVWVTQVLRGAPIGTKIVLPALPDAARAMLPSAVNGRVLAFGSQLDDAHPLVPKSYALSKTFKVTK